MPTLALLDGHSLAYRAFYALPPDLATRSGQVTNAVYGFTSMLIKLIGDHAPDGLVVTWDVGRTTFRTEEYPEYKAQRRSTPDRFRTQLPLIREVLDAMQIAQVEQAGYEADDVIASLVRQAERDGWDVLVVTGDRDSFQLVDSKVKVVYTRRGISDTVLVDPEWVEKKYGVRPDQYLDYAALRGDTSDNLPGVPGGRVKTASRLVSTYGDLDGVYRNIDKLTPRLRQNLQTYRDRVFRNRSLMGLVDDLDLGLETTGCGVPNWTGRPPRRCSTGWSSRPCGPGSWRTRKGSPNLRGVSIEVDVRVAQTPEGVARARVSAGMVVEPVYDAGALAGLVIVGDGDPEGEPADGSAEEAFFVPAPHLEHLREPLADPSVPVSSYRRQQLFRELIERGYTLSGLVFDPVLAGYIIDPAARSESLEDLASKYVGLDLSGASSDGGDRGQGELDFGGGPDLEGAGSRVVATRMLRPVMEAELARRGQMDLFARWNCLSCRCSPGWSWPASWWIRPISRVSETRSGRNWLDSRAASTTWPGRLSTSTRPCSFGRCCSTSSVYPCSRRRRRAHRAPMHRCWRSWRKPTR